SILCAEGAPGRPPSPPRGWSGCNARDLTAIQTSKPPAFCHARWSRKSPWTVAAMLTSLLAASDLSSRSEPAVWRAAQLAGAAQARLAVLHVVEDDQPEARMHAEMRSAQARLDGQ